MAPVSKDKVSTDWVRDPNRDHHVRNQHEDGTFDNTDANETVDESFVPLTFVPELNLSINLGLQTNSQMQMLTLT